MAKVISMVQTFLRLGLLVLVLIGMTQIVGAQVETELKCSADKFYNICRHNVMQLTTVFPGYFKSVKIIKGDGKGLGSIRQWQYVLPETEEKIVTLYDKKIKNVDQTKKSIDKNKRTLKKSRFAIDFKDLILIILNNDKII
ncbi:hypothetical protein MKX01_005432 [Papaver californicum]|nr:hypothetical protein MKX01_005432 [Papaver californicum]